MRSVLKEQVGYGATTLRLPQGVNFLHVLPQQDTYAVWFEGDLNDPSEDVIIIGIMTGQVTPDRAEYIGTTQINGDTVPFVLHFYARRVNNG